MSESETGQPAEPTTGRKSRKRWVIGIAVVLVIGAIGNLGGGDDADATDTVVAAAETVEVEEVVETVTTTTLAATTTTEAPVTTTTLAATTTTEQLANALCVEAYERAAAVDQMGEAQADLFPVFVHCSLQEAIDAAVSYPAAFDLEVGEDSLATWCHYQRDSLVSDSTFSELVEGVSGSVGDTALCQELLG